MGSRMFNNDRAQFDVDVSFVSSADQRQLGNCVVDPLTCYGSSEVTTISTNALLYYRFARNWLGLVNAGFGYQTFTSVDVAQPANLLITGLVRVAYRF